MRELPPPDDQQTTEALACSSEPLQVLLQRTRHLIEHAFDALNSKMAKEKFERYEDSLGEWFKLYGDKDLALVTAALETNRMYETQGMSVVHNDPLVGLWGFKKEGVGVITAGPIPKDSCDCDVLVCHMESLKGKVLTSIAGAQVDGDTITMIDTEGGTHKLFHDQDCCESVSICDVEGDLEDLIGAPIVYAEEVTGNALDIENEGMESGLYTFYRIGTAKGGVVIRWLGESNGYYSESVEYKYQGKPKQAVITLEYKDERYQYVCEPNPIAVARLVTDEIVNQRLKYELEWHAAATLDVRKFACGSYHKSVPYSNQPYPHTTGDDEYRIHRFRAIGTGYTGHVLRLDVV